MLKPTLLAVLLLRTIDGLKAFDVVYALTGGGPGDVTEVLSSFAYQSYFSFLQYGQGAAYAMVTFALITATSWFYVRAMMRQIQRSSR